MLNRINDRFVAEVFLAGKETRSGKDTHEKRLGNRSDKIKTLYSKWFEPRSISNLSSVVVRVSVVLKRTVGDSDCCLDNLSGSHLQSQSEPSASRV